MAFTNLQFGNHSKSIEDNIDKLTNVDAEIAVIGCLLWDNRSYEKIADFLTEDHFTDLNNKNKATYIVNKTYIMTKGNEE